MLHQITIETDTDGRVLTSFVSRDRKTSTHEAQKQAKKILGMAGEVLYVSNEEAKPTSRRRFATDQPPSTGDAPLQRSGENSITQTFTLEEAMKRGYQMAAKYAKESFGAGKKEAQARNKEKLAALRERARALNEEKRRINKAVKAINRMADDEHVIYGVQQEIKEKLAGYDLKKRSKNVLERRAELEAYLAAHPEAGDTMDPKDLKYLGTQTIGGGLGQMTLADVEQLRDEVAEMYERGKREWAAWDAARQERADKKHKAWVDTLMQTAAELPKVVKDQKDLKKQYDGVKGKLEHAKDWVYSNTLTGQRFFDWLEGRSRRSLHIWLDEGDPFKTARNIVGMRN